MNTYSNIEKSGFHHGQYVGYAPLSGAWSIKKTGKGWLAFCKTNRDCGFGCVSRKTLKEISQELRVR
jgi:hypothetical protein